MFYLTADNYNILLQDAFEKIKSINNAELEPAIS